MTLDIVNHHLDPLLNDIRYSESSSRPSTKMTLDIVNHHLDPLPK